MSLFTQRWRTEWNGHVIEVVNHGSFSPAKSRTDVMADGQSLKLNTISGVNFSEFHARVKADIAARKLKVGDAIRFARHAVRLGATHQALWRADGVRHVLTVSIKPDGLTKFACLIRMDDVVIFGDAALFEADGKDGK